MRLRNFLFQMGFAVFAAALLAVFTGNLWVPGLYVLFHLILAFFIDRKTVRKEREAASIMAKYPPVPKPDTVYAVGESSVTLKDSFVKEALVGTISMEEIPKKQKKTAEHFYAAIMAGDYLLKAHTIQEKSRIPGNDSTDDCLVHCGGKQFSVSEAVFKKCRPGDTLVTVTVAGCKAHSVLIWLDPEGEAHLIANRSTFAYGSMQNKQ